jgi:hypothetical protein
LMRCSQRRWYEIEQRADAQSDLRHMMSYHISTVSCHIMHVRTGSSCTLT